MSEYTKGPWTFCSKGKKSFVVGQCGQGPFFDLVCVCDDNESEAAIADARLMAAAPELLAALEEFVEEVDPDCGAPTCKDCGAYRKARAAIAKAKGE